MKAAVEVSAYESTANSQTDEAVAAAIRDLEKIHIELPDSSIYVFANDKEPVAPRIGGSILPESTLKAIAAREYDRRNRIESERRTHRRWLFGTVIYSPLLVLLGYWLNS